MKVNGPAPHAVQSTSNTPPQKSQLPAAFGDWDSGLTKFLERSEHEPLPELSPRPRAVVEALRPVSGEIIPNLVAELQQKFPLVP
jgi:hypothetical protein